jgi:hypothetical protein
MSYRVGISGLQEAQAANLRDIQAVKPSGGLGRAVEMVTIDAHRYSLTVTHVDTGALRASQRMDMVAPARWHIFIDPSARNPRSNVLVSQYAEVENARGGSHGFADETFNRAEVFVNRAASFLLGEIR